MLHKFINSIRHYNPSSGFDAYYVNLQKDGRTGLPTASEARSDFQRIVWTDFRIIG